MPMSTCINGYIQIKFDYYNPIHTPYPCGFFWQFHEFKRSSRGNVYLLSHSFEIWYFSGEWMSTNTKFQHNVSKITPARQKAQ